MGIVLVLVGFCIYMECKFSTIKMVKSEMTQEKILKECPEIAITEEDLALEEFILGLPEVQMMIKQSKENGSYVSVSNEKAFELLAGWIEEGWTMIELGYADNTVYLFWIKDGEKILSYNYSVDGRNSMEKSIGIYQKHQNGTTSFDTLYENINGSIKKIVFKRQWFYWATELLENGYTDNIFFGT